MNKKPKFTRRLVAAGCSIALALGAAGSANAGVLAQGVLEITNFLITNVAGTALNESQFQFLVPNHNTDGTATLNGTADSGSLTDFTYPFAMDLAQQSVGVNPFGENNYTHRPAGYGGYFARTDTNLAGDSICYDISNPGGCPPGGVTAQVVGEVQLNATGDGSTQGNIGLQADFVFALTQTQAVQVHFDADDYLIAFMGPLARIPGSSALASSAWVLNLTGDDGLSYTFRPNGIVDAAGEIEDDCSLNEVRGRLLPGVSTHTCIGSFSAQSPVLTAGVAYHLSIRHAIETDATKLVPEPATLALLGAGLLGLFGVSRRRDRI